jgi:uncharacterized coiled-coil DUF342 family protein
MLTPEERKAIHAHLDELQPRIKALKQQLKELYDQKEQAFHQRTPAGKEISRLIQDLKQRRQERDQFTDEVKKLKENRSGLNEIIKKKIEEAKKLNAEKKKAAAKLGLKENPGRIKMLMEKLETRIETEALPFEKEQAVMKEIKELKKRYDEAKKASAIWDTAHQLGKDIDALREQADEIHRQMQQKAKLSQEKHELLVEESRKVNALRSESSTFTKAITEKKAALAALSKELDGLLKQQAELTAKLSAERKEQEAAKEQQRAKKFSEKLAEVKAKMAKGEKLTTEDILVLQGE